MLVDDEDEYLAGQATGNGYGLRKSFWWCGAVALSPPCLVEVQPCILLRSTCGHGGGRGGGGVDFATAPLKLGLHRRITPPVCSIGKLL